MTDSPNSRDPDAPEVREDLFVLVYDELRRLAARQLAQQHGGSHTLQPTALVHEAWMRLSSADDTLWENQQHYFRAAALAMRRILVDRARGKSSLKRGGFRVDLDVAIDVPAEQTPESHILLMDECLQKMEKDHPECAKVVQLKFFAGMSNQETAALLGSSLRSVERQWAFARSKLYQMMRGRVSET
jgi:RNA polymerase sigma factor (TIGR02999 family)